MPRGGVTAAGLVVNSSRLLWSQSNISKFPWIEERVGIRLALVYSQVHALKLKLADLVKNRDDEVEAPLDLLCLASFWEVCVKRDIVLMRFLVTLYLA